MVTVRSLHIPATGEPRFLAEFLLLGQYRSVDERKTRAKTSGHDVVHESEWGGMKPSRKLQQRLREGN